MQKYFGAISLIVMSGLSLAQPPELLLLRHLHKQNGDNPALSLCGQAQAEVLKQQLAGLTIRQVWHTPYQRTTQTAELIASPGATFHLYDAKQPTSIKTQILAANDTVLVVGHSNTIPVLVEALSGEKVQMKETDYGTLYRFTWFEGRWNLQIQPLSRQPKECAASVAT